MSSQRQHALRLDPHPLAEPQPILLPSPVLLEGSSNKYDPSPYWPLFPTRSDREGVSVLDLPFSRALREEDRMALVFFRPDELAVPGPELVAPSSNNRLVADIWTGPQELKTTSHPVFLLYARAGRAFHLRPDWEALHDTLYGARLARRGGGSIDQDQNTQQLVEQYYSYRERLELSRVTAASEEQESEEDDESWEDEAVKPKELILGQNGEGTVSDAREEAGSDRISSEHRLENNDSDEYEDEKDEEEENDEHDEEDDESELESDGEDDPKNKALLEAISKMILKDGKLDLERLGLVEKNGKLVPRSG